METCVFIVLFSAALFSGSPVFFVLPNSTVVGQPTDAGAQNLVGDWRANIGFPGTVALPYVLKIRPSQNGNIIATLVSPTYPNPLPVNNITLVNSLVSFEWPGGGNFKGTLGSDGKVNGTLSIGSVSTSAQWIQIETAAQIAAASNGGAASGPPTPMTGAQSSKLILSAPLPNTTFWTRFDRNPRLVRLGFTILPDGTTTDVVDLDATPNKNSPHNMTVVGPSIDAVKSWRYKPYSVNGKLAAIKTTVQFKFGMDVPNLVTAIYQ